MCLESSGLEVEQCISLPGGAIRKWWFGDFPGGPVVKTPPSNAGDPNLIPGQGAKIPHAV